MKFIKNPWDDNDVWAALSFEDWWKFCERTIWMKPYCLLWFFSRYLGLENRIARFNGRYGSRIARFNGRYGSRTEDMFTVFKWPICFIRTIAVGRVVPPAPAGSLSFNCMMISYETFSLSPSSKMKKRKQTIREVKTTSNIGRGAISANLQLTTSTTVIVLAM